MSRTYIHTEIYDPNPDFYNHVKHMVVEHKLVHLIGVPQHIEPKCYYADISQKMGEVVLIGESVAGDSIAERWVDIKYDALLTHTFQHSNTRQPLHTDSAYTSNKMEIVFFFCILSAQAGGATTFIDVDVLVNLLCLHDLQLFHKLIAMEVVFSKGNNQYKRSKILFKDNGSYKINWNYFRVSKENSSEVMDACFQFHIFVEERITNAGIPDTINLKRGECVFFS